MATAVVKPLTLEPKKRTEYKREYFRERYATDPEFRQRRIEIIKTCQNRHPEYRERAIQRKKERYQNDPEFRERCIRRAKQQYEEKKQKKATASE